MIFGVESVKKGKSNKNMGTYEYHLYGEGWHETKIGLDFHLQR